MKENPCKIIYYSEINIKKIIFILKDFDTSLVKSFISTRQNVKKNARLEQTWS